MYTAWYLHEYDDGGIMQPIYADSWDAAETLAKTNAPDGYGLKRLERDDGVFLWRVELDSLTLGHVRNLWQSYNVAWQRLSDRAFYERAWGGESRPEDEEKAREYKRRSDYLLWYLRQREKEGAVK